MVKETPGWIILLSLIEASQSTVEFSDRAVKAAEEALTAAQIADNQAKEVLKAARGSRARARVHLPLGHVCEPCQGGVACGRCHRAALRRQLRGQGHLTMRQTREFQTFIRSCFIQM